MIRFVVIALLLVQATTINGGFKVEDNVPDQEEKLNLFGRDEMLRHLNEMYDYSMDNGQNLPAEEQPVGIYEEKLRIPGEKVRANDSYLCTSFEQSAKSIVGFEPLDSNHAAHHIILFVCDEPGSDRGVWNCGEMSQSGVSNGYVEAPVCRSSNAPIYAWSHGAGKDGFFLPKDTGFPVGTNSKNAFIVLQVHYMNAQEKRDDSGVKIVFSLEEQPKTASTLLLVTGGSIEPKKRDNFEAACVIDEDVEMHPIAFRAHTHRHGEKVGGWVVSEDDSGKDQWQLLGERSPQQPQIFEPVKNSSIVIRQGQVLASRCTINNNEDHKINIGPTSEDEMCNFYLMYWTEGEPLSDNVCYSPGAPNYKWSREARLNHIPQ